MVIRLKGKSLKGKNRIREWGELWIIRARPTNTQAPSDQILLDSVVEKNGHPETRWIKPLNDQDFEIVERL